MTDTLSLHDDMYGSLEEITVLAGITVSMPVRHFKGLHLLLSSEKKIGETFNVSFVRKPATLFHLSTCNSPSV